MGGVRVGVCAVRLPLSFRVREGRDEKAPSPPSWGKEKGEGGGGGGHPILLYRQIFRFSLVIHLSLHTHVVLLPFRRILFTVPDHG